MLHKLRPRSAYDVMAAIGFFVAIAGGGAYAAATIGAGDIRDNAVRSRHIKARAVKAADLAASSVGTKKVADGSLLKKDFKAGQLPKGDPGEPGPGAVQFQIHADAGTVSDNSPTVDGLSARILCTTPSGMTTVRLQLTATAG